MRCFGAVHLGAVPVLKGLLERQVRDVQIEVPQIVTQERTVQVPKIISQERIVEVRHPAAETPKGEVNVGTGAIA